VIAHGVFEREFHRRPTSAAAPQPDQVDVYVPALVTAEGEPELP
jgi:hypothetical protein